MTPSADHRPWPLPDRPWAMAMRWHDVLFMHWPIDAAALCALIPPALAIDTYDGQAWLGVVPFRMTGVRPRLVPPLPGFSAFGEINVRTYVTAAGKPGVWFFSLDAANRLAVWGARRSYYLPYYFARISLRQDHEQITYESTRHGNGARFAATYRPTGVPYQSTRGSLDHWLTERYCLYAADKQGEVFCGEIHHRPWPLQPASAEIQSNTITAPLGLALPQTTPLLHFARRLDVVAWRLRRVYQAWWPHKK